ncbi:dystrobrevin beta-like isoform X2 [Liolophura sinensis]|uniref:dystrobrevin beta-like isoform X2 n=1 Tax=Liolophura sinensis TaxID=3198878 RepID=UPI0031598325
MSQCMDYRQSNSFASVIENINRELQSKGYLVNVEESRLIDDTSATTKALVEHRQMMTEMRSQNFDVIRFATYRTACKLRFIQKKTNLYLVDIWNIIEAFRENGLNTLEPQSELNVSRLEGILTSIYNQLNKRLPSSQQINVDQCNHLLLNWLLSAYERDGKGRIQVFSLKVALSHLCSGKLMDKLRYMFTQISDSSGYLIRSKFKDYLRDILALPEAVYEGPSFGFSDAAVRSCFDGRNKVNVNDFLDVMMSDPGPQCLMWFPILHRMAQVENVFHPVQCEGCNRESFTGFRYKCQRCFNYQLCQDCFWRGRTSGNHTNDHEMKEYMTYKSPAKQIGHSLKKTIRCVPSKSHHGNNKHPHFPDQPEKTIDLTHIVPPTPVPVHNGFPEHSTNHSLEVSSIDSGSASRSPSKLNASVDSTHIDDEHRLIARYAARLAADSHNAARSPTELNFCLDSNKAQRELIAQLEAKNREIMKEIQRLRVEQEAHAKRSSAAEYNPTLLAELRLLRQRKDELESRMQALQESRKELMLQLESLMKLLKNHGSPRSTPNSSPRSRSGQSPTTGMLPGGGRGSTPSTPMDSLSGLGGDVRQAFQQMPGSAANARNLRNDLLVAADSVTNAMSSLVKELNSEASGSDGEGEITKTANGGLDSGELFHTQESDDVSGWREEMRARLAQEQQFIAELRARRDRSAHSSRNTSDNEQEQYDGDMYTRTDDDRLTNDDCDSYVRTDDESVIRTDEEDAELYDNHPKIHIPLWNSDLGQFSVDVVFELAGRYTTDDESYRTDEESVIRTDDEEGGNTDWEESMNAGSIGEMEYGSGDNMVPIQTLFGERL